MTVARLPPDHLLLLNKYPVIPRHFLLVTRQFKEQSEDLDVGDLAAMYWCLEAWKRRGEDGRDGEEEGEEGKRYNKGRDEGAGVGTGLIGKRTEASRSYGYEEKNGSEKLQTRPDGDGRQLYAFYNCGEQSGGMTTER